MSRSTLAILIVIGIMFIQIAGSAIYMTLWADSAWSLPADQRETTTKFGWGKYILIGTALLLCLIISRQYWTGCIGIHRLSWTKDDEPTFFRNVIIAESSMAAIIAVVVFML